MGLWRPRASSPAGESTRAWARVCGRVPCTTAYPCRSGRWAARAAATVLSWSGRPAGGSGERRSGVATSASTCTPSVRTGTTRPTSGETRDRTTATGPARCVARPRRRPATAPWRRTPAARRPAGRSGAPAGRGRARRGSPARCCATRSRTSPTLIHRSPTTSCAVGPACTERLSTVVHTLGTEVWTSASPAVDKRVDNPWTPCGPPGDSGGPPRPSAGACGRSSLWIHGSSTPPN